MAKLTDRLKKAFGFVQPISGAGNVLEGNAFDGLQGNKFIPDQNTVRALEPKGTLVPKLLQDRTTGYSQVQNLSHNFTMEKVQAAFRQAENGDTRQLFTYYRDFFIGNAPIVSALSKRKLSTIAEQYIILPASKDPQDVMAAKVIEQILDRCDNFNQALVHLMNAIVYPVSVIEKTFKDIDDDYGSNEFNLRYCIKELHPVDYNLINYRIAYIPQYAGHSLVLQDNLFIQTPPMVSYNTVGTPEDVIYDKDSWEPDLRFWSVLPNGTILQAPSLMIQPDQDRHMVYRCNLLNGIARDNFGGLGKSLLFLSIMSQLGIDVFLKCLQKYGLPFIVAKVDTTQVDTVNEIMQAFGNLNVITAMAVNKDAIVEIQEMNYNGAADAHEKFTSFINDMIYMEICGETLSSNAKSTGLGSGVAKLQGSVRDDIIQYDRLCLSELLEKYLFKQLLQINSIKGNVPSIKWGGGATIDENVSLSEVINNLKLAGLEPTDDALETISEKLGFTIQKVEIQDEDKDIDIDTESDKSDTSENEE